MRVLNLSVKLIVNIQNKINHQNPHFLLPNLHQDNTVIINTNIYAVKQVSLWMYETYWKLYLKHFYTISVFSFHDFLTVNSICLFLKVLYDTICNRILEVYFQI